VPSFPDYTGATADTVNESDDYNVQFYSVMIYGERKQLDALGTVDNSQIGNSQITVNDDGSATVVPWPESASQDQVAAIKEVWAYSAHNAGRRLLPRGRLPHSPVPGRRRQRHMTPGGPRGSSDSGEVAAREAGHGEYPQPGQDCHDLEARTDART
jgi:hypothetical protein